MTWLYIAAGCIMLIQSWFILLLILGYEKNKRDIANLAQTQILVARQADENFADVARRFFATRTVIEKVMTTIGMEIKEVDHKKDLN